MKRYLLETVAFICGAVIMIFGIAGSRVLAPYLGTSTFTWTSLIGVILGSLSFGYWFGGRLADRRPTVSLLSWIILFSAAFILLSTLFKDMLLSALPDLIPGIRGQSLVSSILIFAPASILLGMILPFAIRLKITSLTGSGTTVGKLYAISTIGSLTGTFLAGFFMIPALGTNQVLISLTIILAAVSLLLFIMASKPGKSVYSILLMMLSVLLSFALHKAPKRFIDTDTRYSRVRVYDARDLKTDQPIRFLQINNENSSAMSLDNDGLVFEHSRFLRLAEFFNPGFRSGLMVGGGAYTFPMFYVSQYPDARLDVVEIDPGITRLARQHFRLTDHERIRIIHEDARVFLNHAAVHYDVIYVDAFKSIFALPWHLTSVEAILAMYRLLEEDGIVVVNLISALKGEKGEFLAAEFNTFSQVFPEVRVFAVDDPGQTDEIQSIIMLALKSTDSSIRKITDPLIEDFLRHEVTEMIPESDILLTDNHAPVNHMINKAIR